MFGCQQIADGYLLAHLRRKIQNETFAAALRGSWEILRDIRVGAFVGAATEETTIVVKYIFSIVRAASYLIGATVLGLTALAVSAQITLLFAATSIPALLLFQFLFSVQARISRNQTAARQGYAADITERFNNLLQIKVGGNTDKQISVGLRQQKEVIRLEVLVGYCQAAIGTTKLLVPVIGLVLLYGWSKWVGRSFADSLHLFAGVGLLGLRAVNHLDNLLSMVGVLSQCSGSLEPVGKLLFVPPEPNRRRIRQQIERVEMADVAYAYPGGAGVKNVSLSAGKGTLLVMRGASGSGKTTVANLIAGLYLPDAGNVDYVDIAGTRHSSGDSRPAIGYVTQDIQLFHGSIRDNLTAFSESSDDETWLWDCLRSAGAADFVTQMGGLDAEIAEAGRSLSGGQRRRLGIARVLVDRPQVLILDEVTAGLDDAVKHEIIRTVESIARQVVTVVITHDPEGFGGREQAVFISAIE